MRLFFTSTKNKRKVLTAPRAKRNANGVLSLPTMEVVSSVIAEQTKGPMKDVLFPTIDRQGGSRQLEAFNIKAG